MGNITLIEFNEWLNSSDFVWEDMESCKTYKDTDKLGICIFFPNEWENPKEKVLTEKRFKDFIKTSPVGYEINDTEDFQPSKDFTCDVFCTEVIFEDTWNYVNEVEEPEEQTMSKAELIATLEKHITHGGWDITNIDEGILTVNFYYDEPDNEEEFA
jgi:hypothetical protein